MPTASKRKQATEGRSPLLLSMLSPLRERLEAAAARDNRTLSAFIRVGALERANRILGIEDDDRGLAA